MAGSSLQDPKKKNSEEPNFKNLGQRNKEPVNYQSQHEVFYKYFVIKVINILQKIHFKNVTTRLIKGFFTPECVLMQKVTLFSKKVEISL